MHLGDEPLPPLSKYRTDYQLKGTLTTRNRIKTSCDSDNMHQRVAEIMRNAMIPTSRALVQRSGNISDNKSRLKQMLKKKRITKLVSVRGTRKAISLERKSPLKRVQRRRTAEKYGSTWVNAATQENGDSVEDLTERLPIRFTILSKLNDQSLI